MFKVIPFGIAYGLPKQTSFRFLSFTFNNTSVLILESGPSLQSKLVDPEFNKPFAYLANNEINVFVGFSTSPGKVTLISEEGTEFFQSLAFHLEHDHKHLPLKQIFTKVTKAVSQRSENVPQQLSTLCSMVFFTKSPPIAVCTIQFLANGYH